MPNDQIPEALAARLKAWEAQWACRIKRTILLGNHDERVYVVVMATPEFKPDLEDSLGELDIDFAWVALDEASGFSFNAIAIPPTTEEREDAFARDWLNGMYSGDWD